MSGVTTIEMRLQIELQRKYLSRPGPLPVALQDDLADYPALLARHRWGVVRAADLVGLLQPWSEREGSPGERCFKVAGTRYMLLPGLIDEPWVQVLFDDGSGQLSAWRDRRIGSPLLTIVGHATDLQALEAPRTGAEIERMLRRASALSAETDWMLVSVFGLGVSELSVWLAALGSESPAACLALIRRDIGTALTLLADARGRVPPDTRRRIHALRMLYEITRLVELMRAAAGPERATADDLIGRLATADDTLRCLRHDEPLAHYISDGWMFMSTLRSFRTAHNVELSPAFPLTAYGQGSPSHADIAVASAINDPATFRFYKAALSEEQVVAGTSRTLVRIEGKQPIGFFCGVEQMRLAVIGLRAIARKSGHRGALNCANRTIVGRLALYLLKATDPVAYDAYAEHWAGTHAVKVSGLTRRDLDTGLTDPHLAHDLGAALVIKTERIRKLVAVASDSDFDPYWWGRKPVEMVWASYEEVARYGHSAGADDGALTKGLLRSVTQLGIELPAYFEGAAEVVAEAAALCGSVGAHHTPLARDPALFATALREIGAEAGRGCVPEGSIKLSIVPRARRKMVRLARRRLVAPPVQTAP